MLAAAATAVWQVAALVVVDGRDPVLCGYVYTAPDGLEVRVEKGVRGAAAVFTAVDVRGADAVELFTASFDSRRDLQPAGEPRAAHVRFEADLEDKDAGGMLFAELGVAGGTLRLGRRVGAGDVSAIDTTSGEIGMEWTEHRLPAPLPRDITATYLNCAGDLIRP